MSDIKDIAETGKTVWQSCKKVVLLLKDGKFFAAFRESFVFLKLIYVNHLKGKYVTLGGKRISRTLLAFLALIAVYYVTPSKSDRKPTAEVSETQKDNIAYDNEGIKIYDLRRCEAGKSVGACGYLENYGDYNFGRVTIILTFFTSDGTPIYEGGIEVRDVESHTRSEINITCPDEFSYFNIKEVTLEDKTAKE